MSDDSLKYTALELVARHPHLPTAMLAEISDTFEQTRAFYVSANIQTRDNTSFKYSGAVSRAEIEMLGYKENPDRSTAEMWDELRGILNEMATHAFMATVASNPNAPVDRHLADELLVTLALSWLLPEDTFVGNIRPYSASEELARDGWDDDAGRTMYGYLLICHRFWNSDLVVIDADASRSNTVEGFSFPMVFSCYKYVGAGIYQPVGTDASLHLDEPDLGITKN